MHDALINARPEDAIAPNPDAEVPKGLANRSGGWLHPVANLELFAAADKRLTRMAAMDGMPTRKVERVHARLIKGTKLVIIKAADKDDLSAIPVLRYSGTTKVTINLANLLLEHGLTVETGWKERYDLP